MPELGLNITITTTLVESLLLVIGFVVLLQVRRLIKRKLRLAATAYPIQATVIDCIITIDRDNNETGESRMQYYDLNNQLVEFTQLSIEKKGDVLSFYISPLSPREPFQFAYWNLFHVPLLVSLVAVPLFIQSLIFFTIILIQYSLYFCSMNPSMNSPISLASAKGSV